mgnify:CR=1 FL=1
MGIDGLGTSIGGPKGHDGKPQSLTHNKSFWKVCTDGDFEIVKTVAERTQVDLEMRDDEFDTPLRRAACYGHLRMVKYPNE